MADVHAAGRRGRLQLRPDAGALSEYQLLAVEGDQVRGRVNAVPHAWSVVDEDLPENGWDFALAMAFRPEMPEAATALCLIEARIHPDVAGAGLGTDLLLAARENATALGYSHLLAPIRPTRKHREPDTPIEEYIRRTRPDGTLFDPWPAPPTWRPPSSDLPHGDDDCRKPDGVAGVDRPALRRIRDGARGGGAQPGARLSGERLRRLR